MSKRVQAEFSPEIESLVKMRAKNNSARARVVPLSGNAELYYKPNEGKVVLRKKTSRMPRLPQMDAIAACAAELKGKDFKSRAEVYAFLDKCMAKHGFAGKEKKR